MTGYETDDIVEELFDSLLQKYHFALENTGGGSDHVFDSIDVLYHKLHKTSLNRSGSYIDSPEWLKNKKATINPINKKDDKCFQYVWHRRIKIIKILINNHKEYQKLNLLLISMIVME